MEHNEVFEVNGWAPKFEPLPPNEDKTLPSEERPPKLELKPLPTHLKYAFLGEGGNISSNHIFLLRTESRKSTFGDIENPQNCSMLDNCRH